MLKQMRKKGFAKKVLWFVAIIIVLSFGIFGSASYYTSRTTKDTAGKIFGRNIPLSEFYTTLKHVQVQAQIQYGEKFNQVRQFLNLEGETWDRFILSHEANKRKIKITNDEVIEAIKQYPFFQRDGKFDNKLYNDLLKFAFNLRAVEFEDNVRELLKFGKIYDQITKDINISEREVFEEFKKRNEKTQVSYLLLNAEQFKGQVNIDESKAKQYYEDNKNSFIMPPSISVDYLRFSFTNEMTKEEKDKIKDQAYVVLDELKKNPDFKAVAQKYNLEIKNSGFFNAEKPNLSLGWSFDFITSLFELAPQAITDLTYTESSLDIAQVKEKKDVYIASYDEVKEEIKNILVIEAADSIALQKSEEAQKALANEIGNSKAPDFAEAAKKINQEIGQTPLFNRGQYLPKIGISKEFQDAAFALNTDKKLSDVIKISGGYVILFLDKFEPADSELYKKEKDKLTQELLAEKKNLSFADFVTKLRLEANIQSNMAKE